MDDPNDGAKIGVMLFYIDAYVPCDAFDGTPGNRHGDYVKAVKGFIDSAAAAVGLRPECKATVKKLAARSTCGHNPLLNKAPCVKKKSSGDVICAIKNRTRADGTVLLDACKAPLGGSGTICPGHTHCIDAADTNGDLLIGFGDSGLCNATPTPTPTQVPGVTPSPTPTPMEGHTSQYGNLAGGAVCPMECGSSQFIIGFVGQADGGRITQIAAKCGSYANGLIAEVSTTAACGSGGGSAWTAACPPNTNNVVVGFSGRTDGSYVNQLTLYCAAVTADLITKPGFAVVGLTTPAPIPAVGPATGSAFPYEGCPVTLGVASSADIRADGGLDAFGLGCFSLPAEVAISGGC